MLNHVVVGTLTSDQRQRYKLLESLFKRLDELLRVNDVWKDPAKIYQDEAVLVQAEEIASLIGFPADKTWGVARLSIWWEALEGSTVSDGTVAGTISNILAKRQYQDDIQFYLYDDEWGGALKKAINTFILG